MSDSGSVNVDNADGFPDVQALLPHTDTDEGNTLIILIS